MSKDQGKTKPGTKQNPPAKQKQKVDPTELSDDALNKISGGLGGGSSDTNAEFIKYIKDNIG
jgi:bacteriocin-like protein